MNPPIESATTARYRLRVIAPLRPCSASAAARLLGVFHAFGVCASS